MRTSRLVATLALAAGVAAACDDAPAGTQEAFAPLRVVNGSATDVTVLVDGTPQLATLAAGSISPPIPVTFTSHRVELRPAGSSTNGGSSVLAATSPSSTTYIAALGTTAGAVSAVALADTGAVPAPGTSKLQAVHLAAKAPPLWVWRIQPDFPTAVRFMFPHPYGMSTSYIQAAPGTWQVIVTPEGGDPSRDVLGSASILVDANHAKRVAVLDAGGGKVKIVPLETP